MRVYLDKYNLHPIIDSINENTKHRPGIRIRFENIGSTPAILQEISVVLWLIKRDDFSNIPIEVNRKPLLKNDAIQPKEIRGDKVWQFERAIDAEEIQALAAAAIKGKNYSRFYLRGYVVYDDIFDIRHTNYFLVKVRQNGWYEQKGGKAYNWVQRKKIESDNTDEEFVI